MVVGWKASAEVTLPLVRLRVVPSVAVRRPCPTGEVHLTAITYEEGRWRHVLQRVAVTDAPVLQMEVLRTLLNLWMNCRLPGLLYLPGVTG